MIGIGDLVVFASAFVVAGAVRKSMKMKQEVDLFADQVEEAIEQILSAVSSMEPERSGCLAGKKADESADFRYFSSDKNTAGKYEIVSGIFAGRSIV